MMFLKDIHSHLNTLMISQKSSTAIVLSLLTVQMFHSILSLNWFVIDF